MIVESYRLNLEAMKFVHLLMDVVVLECKDKLLDHEEMRTMNKLVKITLAAAIILSAAPAGTAMAASATDIQFTTTSETVAP